jgi:hypothetical protein
LNQGWPFQGHDESKNSLNKGNFREFHECLAEHDPELGKAMVKMVQVIVSCWLLKFRETLLNVLQLKFYILS